MHNHLVSKSSTATNKSYGSLISKTLVFLLLLNLVGVIYYLTICNKRSTLTIKPISSSHIDSIQCRLSMMESDGWFCERDTDWIRRKMIYHVQNKRNRISDKRFLFFQNNWEPTLQCAFEQRLGNSGDGGKWICDVHRFEEMNDTDLLVYSFGSKGDFSFERAIKEQLPQAEIHTFDMELYECPDYLCTFHQARLGDGKTDGSKSLQMIINELDHQKRQIHILKVDIEGSEFNLFEELFKPSNKNDINIPYIRQILFEIHLVVDRQNKTPIRAHRLFELFRANNYAIFHKEVNLWMPAHMFEYSLIRLNPVFFTLSL